MKMIYLASDHAGFEYKERLKGELLARGFKVQDFGAYELDKNDDYPDYMQPLAKELSENPDNFAIIFGGSGQGEAISVNRFKNVRAAVIACENIDLVILAREHNNANVLSFGARFVSFEFVLKSALKAIDIVFDNKSRHKRRIDKIDSYE